MTKQEALNTERKRALNEFCKKKQYEFFLVNEAKEFEYLDSINKELPIF